MTRPDFHVSAKLPIHRATAQSATHSLSGLSSAVTHFAIACSIAALLAANSGCVQPLHVDSRGRFDANASVKAELSPVPKLQPVSAMGLPYRFRNPWGATVAVVDVDGLLLNSDATGLGSWGENPVSVFRERLDAIECDPHVCAVVVRINTPGGSVTATDIMWRDLHRVQISHLPAGRRLLDGRRRRRRLLPGHRRRHDRRPPDDRHRRHRLHLERLQSAGPDGPVQHLGHPDQGRREHRPRLADQGARRRKAQAPANHGRRIPRPLSKTSLSRSRPCVDAKDRNHLRRPCLHRRASQGTRPRSIKSATSTMPWPTLAPWPARTKPASSSSIARTIRHCPTTRSPPIHRCKKGSSRSTSRASTARSCHASSISGRWILPSKRRSANNSGFDLEALIMSRSHCHTLLLTPPRALRRQPLRRSNPIYDGLISRGVAVSPQETLKLPPPILTDGQAPPPSANRSKRCSTAATTGTISPATPSSARSS